MHLSHASIKLRDLKVFIGVTLPHFQKKIREIRFKFRPHFKDFYGKHQGGKIPDVL